MQERYAKGIYRHCPWCQGRGCLICPAEAEKAYTRAFPAGPQLLVTFDATQPTHLKELEESLAGSPCDFRAGRPGD